MTIKKSEYPVTRILFNLTEYGSSPISVVAYNGDNIIANDYCSRFEQCKSFVDNVSNRCTMFTTISVLMNPSDIGFTDVADFAKKIGDYVNGKLHERRAK